ncbi:hypothetical protein BGZ97_009069, partial [Linnemannia gamsii]
MTQAALQPKPLKTPEYLITGNTISISAQDGLINTNAVIFAQNSLEIGAKEIKNLKHGVFYSGGTMTIGGELDAQFKVRGTSDRTVTESVVAHSEPGKIQAGGAIRLSGQVINDKSQIIAGGTLSNFEGTLAQIENMDAMGERATTDQGIAKWSDREWRGGFKRYFQRHWSGPKPYNLSQVEHDTVSSNLLLQYLNLDPHHVPKRLGDGFYEQQLIRDQIIGLTGHYYLSGYRNPITEFKALMQAGANWAKQFNLTLGIEPTPQQIAALTVSPVWLVNQTVRLPDGSEQTALMPKVYLAQSDISPVPLSGSLISASEIDLTSPGRIKNAGTMLSRGNIHLKARNIDNQRGALVSLDALSLQANDDIDSRAGQLFAGKKITLKAGHDIHLQSQTHTTHAASGSQTALDGITQVQTKQLEAYAESDIHLAATQIKVDENASLEARGDLTLGTATVGAQHQLTWDA